MTEIIMIEPDDPVFVFLPEAKELMKDVTDWDEGFRKVYKMLFDNFEIIIDAHVLLITEDGCVHHQDPIDAGDIADMTEKLINRYCSDKFYELYPGLLDLYQDDPCGKSRMTLDLIFSVISATVYPIPQMTPGGAFTADPGFVITSGGLGNPTDLIISVDDIPITLVIAQFIDGKYQLIPHFQERFMEWMARYNVIEKLNDLLYETDDEQGDN